METRVADALAVIAADISTVALLVMVSLTAFVVSLAFKARRTPDSRRSTPDLRTSIADHSRANRPRTLLARGPAAGTDRRAQRTRSARCDSSRSSPGSVQASPPAGRSPRPACGSRFRADSADRNSDGKRAPGEQQRRIHRGDLALTGSRAGSHVEEVIEEPVLRR